MIFLRNFEVGILIRVIVDYSLSKMRIIGFYDFIWLGFLVGIVVCVHALRHFLCTWALIPRGRGMVRGTYASRSGMSWVRLLAYSWDMPPAGFILDIN